MTSDAESRLTPADPAEARVREALEQACPSILERVMFAETLAPKVVAALRAAHEYAQPSPFFPYALDAALRALSSGEAEETR
jgi:hypothetical protein